MAAVNPPDFLQNAGATHAAEPLRTVLGGLMEGVLAANSMKSAGGVASLLGNALKVQATGSPSMSVDVLNGVAYIPGTEGTNQGVYGCVNDATLNLAITASNPTNPRIDIIVAKVQDAVYSGVTNAWSIVPITGTPAGSPAAPAAPANSIILAQIAVAANATSVTNGNITDKRTYMTASGGRIRCTSTTRPAWVGATTGLGQQIYETDTGRAYFWDGSIWRSDSGDELIQEVTLGVAGTTIQFLSIPQTFKDLRLTIAARTTEAANFSDVFGKFNNDGGGNYSILQYSVDQGGGTAGATGNSQTTLNMFRVAGASLGTAAVFGYGEADILSYSDGSRSNKIAICTSCTADFGNQGNSRIRFSSWGSGGGSYTPAAITRIDLVAGGGANFVVGTVARLYGRRL